MPTCYEINQIGCNAVQQQFLVDSLAAYAELWNLPLSTSDVSSRRVVFAENDDGTLIGIASYFDFPTFFNTSMKVYLDFLWVAPEYHCEGVAVNLLDYVRRYRDVMLRVLEDNPFRIYFESHNDIWHELGIKSQCRLYEAKRISQQCAHRSPWA